MRIPPFIFYLFVVTSAAAGAVIDFERLRHEDDLFNTVPSYEEDGFIIRGEVGTPDAFGAWGTASEHFAGSTALYGNVALAISLSRTDGAVFDVESIDISHLFDFDPALGNDRFVVTFVGTRADASTKTETLNVPRHFGFATYPLSGFSDLVSLRWDQSAFGSAPHQFDNIRIVPEPSAITLILLALISLSIGFLWKQWSCWRASRCPRRLAF